MDISAHCNGSFSPSPSELPNQHQDAADQARERLLAISQADTGSDLQDIAKPIVGEKGVSKEEEPHSPAFDPGKEQPDQDEVYRKKLISISYDGASVPASNNFVSKGSHVASPSPGDGNGCPPS